MLKRAVIIAISLCLMLSASAQTAHREGFGVDDQNNDYFLETDHITRKGYVVYAWQQVNRAQENDIKARFLREQIEFDCNFKKYRIMWTTAYSEHNGQGTLLGSEAVANPVWRPSVPGSLSEKMLSFACVHVFRPK